MSKKKRKEQLRLFVLGDIHFRKGLELDWQEIIEDINNLEADCVLAVGDLTGGKQTGTTEGMKAAKQVLDGLRAPWRTVIGNHDLQADEFASDREAVQSFLSFTGRDTPWFRHDLGPLTIIGLSNTRWRTNIVNKNEIVFEDDQLEWAHNEIASIPNRPVFILAHVPPIGSGLMVMGELHASVGNAFANQNYTPSNVLRLAREHPNVLMWFSGHNHLGQQYRDAISMRLGIHFVHVGTAGRESRDHHRHSRVIDIHDETLVIRTFDHTLRRIDECLDYSESSSLESLIEYRQVIDKSRFVAADAATMRQGPGPLTPRRKDHRFAFLSDAHITGRPYPCQQRVLDWAGRQILGNSVNTIVLGGDLTHHACANQAEAFIDAINLQRKPMLYLPGNNETTGINPAVDRQNFTFVRTVIPIENWPGHAFALATTNTEDAKTAVEELALQLPDCGTVLVIAHFPPSLAGEEAVGRLAKPGLRIEWICGHQHQGRDYEHGPVSVHVCGGLDPIKVRHHRPEILICDWDGADLSVGRHYAPAKFLQPPPHQPNPLGLAYRGEPAELLSTALAENLSAVQFRWPDVTAKLGDRERGLIRQLRQAHKDAFLSLHLPNFTPTDGGVDVHEMDACLEWAADAGMDDLTLHLPKVPASHMFDDLQCPQSNDWARGCLSAYTELARQTIAIGAQLSIENVYNKSRVADHEELLSTRPWHLLRFVEAVRQQLAEEGYSPEQAAKVGIIFDSGHAFRDPKVSKIHGLADWLQHIAPYLQLAHIHQTLPVNGKMTNHQPIDAPCSAQINHTGLLPLFAEVSRRAIPLLIEVRTRDGALASLRSLREIQAQQ